MTVRQYMLLAELSARTPRKPSPGTRSETILSCEKHGWLVFASSLFSNWRYMPTYSSVKLLRTKEGTDVLKQHELVKCQFGFNRVRRRKSK